MDDATWTYPSHGEDTTPEAERRNVEGGAPAAGDLQVQVDA
jgi:hypothetical protein